MGMKFNPFTGNFDIDTDTSVTDHGALSGLGDDDHTQYALLAGRAGGQTLRGGTASGDDLTLSSTSHVTKGTIFVDSDMQHSGHILFSTGATYDIGTEAAPARVIYLDNNNDHAIHMPNSTTAGAATNYTFHLGGGDDGVNGFVNSFTMLMDDCVGNLDANNTFNINLGLADTNGTTPNKFRVTSDTNSLLGQVMFDINIAGNNITPETGLRLKSQNGALANALTPSRFIIDNSCLSAGSTGTFGTANYKTIDFRFDNTSFLKFDCTSANNTGFAVYDIPAHNKNSANYARWRITTTNAVTQTTAGTKTTRATLWLDEPNVAISAGTLTNTATLYVAAAATEATNNYALWVDSGASRFDNNVGIGVTTANAWLHLGAGTATANTAPLKFTSGTNLTNPEQGAVEYDGKNFYATRVSTRRKIPLTNDTITSSTTVANTTTETTLFTATMPANGIAVADMIRIFTGGYYSTANGSDTFTIRWKVGSTTILSMTSTAANVTNVPWHARTHNTVRTLGATGTLMAFGEIDSNGANSDQANTATTTFDTTATMTFTVTVQWSAANASNTLTASIAYSEIL